MFNCLNTHLIVFIKLAKKNLVYAIVINGLTCDVILWVQKGFWQHKTINDPLTIWAEFISLMNYEWITLKCVFPYYLKMLYDTSLLLFSLQIKYCMANNKSSKLVNIVLTTYISGRMKLRVTRTVDDEEGFWGWNKTANGRTWHSIQEWMIITYSQLHHQ